MKHKSPMGPFLRLNRRLWNHVPPSIAELRPVRFCGRFAHSLVRRWDDRRQYFGTFFLRNRPQLELINRLSHKAENESLLKIAVLGCSNGAEVYSVAATLRRKRPELNILLNAVDISQEILDLARKGIYSLERRELVDEPIFQRMTSSEIQQMFDRDNDSVAVKPWIKEGINWHLGDVRDPEVLKMLGPQDLVIANNFLCHMKPPDAEECLRGIARLVRRGGYLIVSGIDLDVRARVATEQKWKPVTELLEDIHEADLLRRDWPKCYWGLEPLDKKCKNWTIRYAAAFQIGEKEAFGNIPFVQSENKATIPPV